MNMIQAMIIRRLATHNMELPLNCRRRRTRSRGGGSIPPADRPLPFGPSMVPDAGGLEVPRISAARVLEDLSNSSSLADPPSAAMPRLLHLCFALLHDLGENEDLTQGCRLHLFDFLRRVLSCDPSPSLLPAIEVFLGNFEQLRGFFVTGYVHVPEKYISAPHIKQRPCWELACNHFISSMAGMRGFWSFLDALSWSGNESREAPQISSREAFELLNIISLVSLPGVVEAHLLLLASRCDSSGADLNSYVWCQNAMNLYVDRLLALGIFNTTDGVKRKDLRAKNPLAYCIKQDTHQKLKNQVNRLLSFCWAHAGDDLPTSERDICYISDRLIYENEKLLHQKFRKEAITVVMSILSKALDCAKQNEVCERNAGMLEEAIRLAAVLRLMGSLLVHILCHFSQMGDAGDKGNETANHKALRLAFSTLCNNIVRLLSRYEPNELHRFNFIGTSGQPVHRERASIQMLAHLASLLVFSVRRRFGFLWRVCLMMMMVAMNLVIVEDGSMDVFQLLKESAGILDTGNCDFTLALVPSADIGNLQMQVYDRKRSSKAIALQMNAVRNQSNEKVDGRPFLQCLPGYKHYPARDADLVDFIECKAGKDYSHALEQLDKFRSFKDRKRDIMAKRKKEEIRRLMFERVDMPRLAWKRKHDDTVASPPILPWR